MNKFYFIVFILLTFASHAQYDKDDSLRKDLIDCFIKTDKVEGYNHILFIRELLSDKEYDDEMKGIFCFYLLTSETYRHIIIIKEDTYEIIDMTQKYTDIIDKLLQYFKMNRSSTKDILIYMGKVNEIRIENENMGWRISDWKLKD